MEERTTVIEQYGIPKSSEKKKKKKLEDTKFNRFTNTVIINKFGTCRVSYRTNGFMAGREEDNMI